MNDMDKHRERNEKVKLDVAAQTLDRAIAERNAVIDQHLKALTVEQNEDAQMVITIAQAAVHQRGLPGPTTVDDVAAECEAFALKLARANRARQWTETKALLETHNARNPNPFMVAAAKRAGVDLVETPVPRLVEG